MNINDIIATVAKFYGVNQRDIRGPSRHKSITEIRHLVMYLARDRGFTLMDIGAALGWRHHTTIMHGVAVAEDRIRDDWKLAGQIEFVTEDIDTYVAQRQAKAFGRDPVAA